MLISFDRSVPNLGKGLIEQSDLDFYRNERQRRDLGEGRPDA
jgi:hypothetical protein